MRKSQNKWCLDISEAIEEIDHGDTLVKFVATTKGDTSVNGGPYLDVTIHGLITSSGKFIILSEAFESREDTP